MRIDSKTKISKILKQKPEAIGIISDINSNFKKLQNPILRRSLAARVSVSDAARIGKVNVNDFLKALEGIGFEVDYNQEDDAQTETNDIPPDFSNKKIVTLDVRPIIAEGKDPFGHINKVAKKIKREEVLLIINDFEPIPLVEYLVSKNFIHWMTEDKEGNYLTYFKLNCKKANFFQRLLGKKDIPCQFHNISAEKNDEKTIERRVKEEGENNPEKFDQIKQQYEGKLVEIDVRDLEMPLPMQNILLGIDKLSDGEALFVHHKRIPQFLLPELKKRNWQYIAKEINADYTYLIVYKKA